MSKKQIKPDKTNRIPPTTKTCLKCQEPFTSTGKFICPKCTAVNDELYLSKRELEPVRMLKSDGTEYTFEPHESWSQKGTDTRKPQ